LAVEAVDQEQRASGARFDGQRVLVVGGSMDELLVLTPLLEDWGLSVAAAGDAAEAIDSLHDETDCAVVLLDVAAPGSEACVTIQRIRESVAPRRLPVLAMADASVPEPQCEGVGAAEVLVKPLDPAALREAIARHCGGTSAAAGADEA
jgi:two-component system nitrogen regulation response regulator GlnG